MYLLDTNAVIYYLKDDAEAVPVVRKILSEASTPVYISVITEIELLAFPRMNSIEEGKIDAMLQAVPVLPAYSHIARLAGQMKAAHTMNLADSIIAATALLTGSTLLTRNVRDFKKIPNLRMEEV